jgi:hypothetical protein
MRDLQKKPKKTKKPRRVAKRPTRSSVDNSSLFRSKPYQQRYDSGFSFGSTGPHYTAVSSPFQPPQSTLKTEISNLKESILETNIKQEQKTNTLEKKGMALKEEIDQVVFDTAQDNRENEVNKLIKPRKKRSTKKEMLQKKLSAYEMFYAEKEALGDAPSFSNSTQSGLGNIGNGGFNSTKMPNRFASTPVSKKKHSVSPLVESAIEQTAERPLTESVGDLAETGIYGSEPPAQDPVFVDVVEEGKGQLGGTDPRQSTLVDSIQSSASHRSSKKIPPPPPGSPRTSKDIKSFFPKKEPALPTSFQTQEDEGF